MSALSAASAGPSAEYEESDLDAEWLSLLRDIDGYLAAKNREPIRSARCAVEGSGRRG